MLATALRVDSYVERKLMPWPRFEAISPTFANALKS